MRNVVRGRHGAGRPEPVVAIALGVALASTTGRRAARGGAGRAGHGRRGREHDGRHDHHTARRRDGASLAGHTFDVYRIGTYTDQILNGTRISSLGVRGDTASNAWAADAIGIANAYDPSTADDIGKVYGYDDAGNIANIKMDSQTRQLRNIGKSIAQSSKKPAAIQGGANLTTTQSTLTINVPSEGLYYITDSAGNPIMVGTKSGNANIHEERREGPQWRTLGTAVVKAKSVRVDKKVPVQRNGTTVGTDRLQSGRRDRRRHHHQHGRGDRAEQAGRLRGQVQAHRPAEGPDVRAGLAERPAEERAADRHHGRRGHLRRDHAEQREEHPRRPDPEDRGQQARRPGSRHPRRRLRGIDGRKLLDKYSNRTIVITYRMTVDKASVTDPPTNTIHTYGTFTDGIHFTTITDQDKADIKAYDFTLRKVDAGNVNTLLDGAQFQIHATASGSISTGTPANGRMRPTRVPPPCS